MCGNVPVRRRLCVLFLLFGELCVVLLGLLATPSEMGKNRHGEWW